MSTISDTFRQYVSDPTLSIQAILDDLAMDQGGNREIVDASNAFVMLLEASTHLASQSLLGIQTSLQRRFCSLAGTYQELYPHLSSEDLRVIFAQPTRTTLSISILQESYLSTAVRNTEEACYIAVIPKRTEVHIDDLTFSFDRGVAIRWYDNQVVKVNYVDDTLNANIHADLAAINNVVLSTTQDDASWIQFTVDVTQTNYFRYTFTALPSIAFRESVSYQDMFQQIEIFYTKDGVRLPMATTLSERVYDPDVPTAIITVDDDQGLVSIFIPPIYTIAGLIGTDIEVIVSSTKGDIDRVFDNYNLSDYSVTTERGQSTFTPEETAFLAMTYLVYLSAPLDGGRDRLSFTAIRSRLMDRAFGHPQLPITRNQLTHNLGDLGYTSLIYKEGVAGRTYVISDDTPSPPGMPYDTYPGIGMLRLTTSLEELEGLPYTRKFGSAVTILPTQMYANAGIDLLPTTETHTDLLSLSNPNRATVLNSRERLFSPLYYSVRNNDNILEVMPWSLNRPMIDRTDRIAANSSVPDVFKRVESGMLTTETGFRLIIKFDLIPASYGIPVSQVFGQLGLRETDGTLHYVNATISSDNDYLYLSFDILSTFELTNDAIHLTLNDDVWSSGTFQLEMIYGVSTRPSGFVGSDIDARLSLGNTSKAALLYEVFDVTIGTPLPYLWTDTHAYTATTTYKRYTEDVVHTVTSTSLTSATNSTAVPFTLDENCNVVYNAVTTSTQVSRDEQGNVIYLHRVGDYILDEFGRLIPETDISRRFVFNVLCLSDHYLYADVTSVVDALRLLQSDTVQKSTVRLTQLRERLLGRTDIYYTPRRTIGYTEVLRDGQVVGLVPLQVTPTVSVTLPRESYNNTSVRTQLKNITVKVLNAYFQNSVVSYDGVVNVLRTTYGSSAVSVTVSGLPEVMLTGAVELPDQTVRLCIATRATVTLSGELSVEDHLTMQFTRV